MQAKRNQLRAVGLLFWQHARISSRAGCEAAAAAVVATRQLEPLADADLLHRPLKISYLLHTVAVVWIGPVTEKVCCRYF